MYLWYKDLRILYNFLLKSLGIEWGEDDDDDFELEETKEAKMAEKSGKEQIGMHYNWQQKIISKPILFFFEYVTLLS